MKENTDVCFSNADLQKEFCSWSSTRPLCGGAEPPGPGCSLCLPAGLLAVIINSKLEALKTRFKDPLGGNKTTRLSSDHTLDVFFRNLEKKRGCESNTTSDDQLYVKGSCRLSKQQQQMV